jgi:hypothetical protein
MANVRAITLGLTVVVCCASLSGQSLGRRLPVRSNPSATQAQASAPSRRLYQNTWYDSLLRQFNPQHFDYGDWLDERRQMLLDATARNPYFKYSLLVTLIVLFGMAAYAKLWYDLRKTRWLAAEKLGDALSHDRLSREAAGAAIARYNEHIEKCNRAIEAQESGLTFAGSGNNDADSLRRELEDARNQKQAAIQERDKLQTELHQTSAAMADLSLRLAGSAGKGSGNGGGPGTTGEATHADLVQHINRLQQQLHAEREKNKRLKGGT